MSSDMIPSETKNMFALPGFINSAASRLPFGSKVVGLVESRANSALQLVASGKEAVAARKTELVNAINAKKEGVRHEVVSYKQQLVAQASSFVEARPKLAQAVDAGFLAAKIAHDKQQEARDAINARKQMLLETVRSAKNTAGELVHQVQANVTDAVSHRAQSALETITTHPLLVEVEHRVCVVASRVLDTSDSRLEEFLPLTQLSAETECENEQAHETSYEEIDQSSQEAEQSTRLGSELAGVFSRLLTISHKAYDRVSVRVHQGADAASTRTQELIGTAQTAAHSVIDRSRTLRASVTRTVVDSASSTLTASTAYVTALVPAPVVDVISTKTRMVVDSVHQSAALATSSVQRSARLVSDRVTTQLNAVAMLRNASYRQHLASQGFSAAVQVYDAHPWMQTVFDKLPLDRIITILPTLVSAKIVNAKDSVLNYLREPAAEGTELVERSFAIVPDEPFTLANPSIPNDSALLLELSASQPETPLGAFVPSVLAPITEVSDAQEQHDDEFDSVNHSMVSQD
jgi:hypothetical protein